MKFRRPLRPLLALLTAHLVLSGCGEPDPGKRLASARALLEKSDYVAAQIELKALLQKQPDVGEARQLLGRARLEAGDAAGAQEELQRALQAGYPLAEVLPVLAAAMVAQGQGAALLKQYGNAELPSAPADAALRTQLAVAAASMGDLDRAEKELKRAIAEAPKHGPALVWQARLMAMRGDRAGALAAIEQLLAARPELADAWALKGDLLLAERGGDPAPALEAYRRSLALDARPAGVHAAAVRLLITGGDMEGAAKQWADMRKAAPDSPLTLFLEGVLADARGDDARARAIGQQLLKGSPNDPRVLLLAGKAELKLGSYGLAEAHLIKVVQAMPTASLPRRLLATAQMRIGQVDRALATLAPLLSGPTPDIDAMNLQGQALMTQGETKAAQEVFERVATLRPSDPRVQTAQAVVRLARGDDAAAMAALEAIAAKDTGAVADMALISARLQRGDEPGALKAIDALEAKSPKDPLPDQLRARIAMVGKNAAAARQHLELALRKNPDYLPALTLLTTLDLADNKPAAARARLEASVERQPRRIGPMMALAELNAKVGGKPEESVRWLERAIAADPTDPVPRIRLLDLYLALGDTQAGLVAAQSALGAIPDQPGLLDRLARLQMSSGNARLAVTTYRKLAAVRPNSAAVQLGLAQALLADRNPSEAAAAVRRASVLAPDALEVARATAGIALAEKRYDDALKIARKVQTQFPGQAIGFVMEGDVALRTQQWDAAAAAFRKALSKPAPGDAAQRLHAALTGGGKAAEAEAFAAEWRKTHPDDMAFLIHIGSTAMAAGRHEEAEAAFRVVADRQPKNAAVLNNLAYVVAAQNKPGGSVFAERAVELMPKSPAMLDTLAYTLSAEKQWRRAIDVQQQAVVLAPEVPVYRLHLARIYVKSGDKVNARTELDALAALGRKFPRQSEVAALRKALAE